MTPRAGSFEYNEHVDSLSKPVMYEVEVEGRASVGRWGDIMVRTQPPNLINLINDGGML